MRPMKQKWTLVPVFVFLTKHHLNFEKHLDAQLSVKNGKFMFLQNSRMKCLVFWRTFAFV